MARILFTSFGSYGDLHPYIAVGLELRNRGHRVTVGTSASYRSRVESEGLEFAPIRPDVSLEDRDLMAYLFDPRRGSERVIRMVASVVRESYEDTLAAAEPADVVVTHPISFGSVLVAKKLRKLWLSSVLAPISFFSAYDPPVLAPAPWLSRLYFVGPAVLRVLFTAGRREALKWIEPLLELRKEIGLDQNGNPIFEGSHSPRLVLGLFSRLLGEPQPDWPPQTLVTGFAFYDGQSEPKLAPQLEDFLEAGSPPVVFTLGSSAVGAAGDFYLASLEAVSRLGTRALFLTGPHPQGLPETLPPGLLAMPYAPHSRVFPRAAAVVHQGGVGTTGQAMRSGRPMLVVPFAHDQFDHGERMRRLGVGEVIYRKRYGAGRAEEVLRRLITEPAYARSASLVCRIIREENGADTAASAIEEQIRLAA